MADLLVPDLHRLLRPQSIAVVGGSWGRSVIEQCQRMGFAGDIWPVHPSHKEILGCRVYPSIDDLPSAPDACFIGVNRHQTIAIVKQLSAVGGGGAVCFASGFSEAASEDGDGEALQAELLRAAGDLPVVGPNCYGLINYLDGALLWPDQHGGQRVQTGVAIITQSSNIAINMTMQRRALPVAYIMTAGNQAQISLADMGIALLDDPRVTALGLHIEGFGDIERFEALAAKAREHGKGIVAIKVGRSVKAQTAMVSHTNSLTGSDSASDALLARIGVARVDSIPVLLESLKLLHAFGPFSGNTVASMSCSGGEASMMADAVHCRNLLCNDLTSAQQSELRLALGPMVALANPLDYHTYIWNDSTKMTATFSAMLRNGADLTFLIIDFPRQDRCTFESWIVAINALVEAQRATGSRVALLASMPENMPESVAHEMLEKGVPAFSAIDDALDAVQAVNKIGESIQQSEFLPTLVRAPTSGEAQMLSEARAKAVLLQAGLMVPQSEIVRDKQQALQAAKRMDYPVVIKVSEVAHKTEVGGVHLNLRSDAALCSALQLVLEQSDAALIEPFIDEAVAELLIGVVREPTNTFLLTVGAGGVQTEMMRDTVSLLLPVTDEQIYKALNSTRVALLLHGYRGQAGADLESVVTTVQRLCRWVEANASTVDEVEINPLLCLPDRTVAVDAIIRMRL